MNFVDPVKRNVAMVFQNYALYPHMTVFKNVAFPLQMAKQSKEDIRESVKRAATILELDELLDRYPDQLSGGQRQRVALARAIVREPDAFLMDEPLSNLDALLRVQTRGELTRLHQRLGTTTIYVTHDQVEAMTMGHRIAVMQHGVIQQLDVPEEVYSRPTNVFVATFIGSPPMNLIPGSVARHNGGWGSAGRGSSSTWIRAQRASTRRCSSVRPARAPISASVPKTSACSRRGRGPCQGRCSWSSRSAPISSSRSRRRGRRSRCERHPRRR